MPGEAVTRQHRHLGGAGMSRPGISDSAASSADGLEITDSTM
jgi:hypothetical protein